MSNFRGSVVLSICERSCSLDDPLRRSSFLLELRTSLCDLDRGLEKVEGPITRDERMLREFMFRRNPSKDRGVMPCSQASATDVSTVVAIWQSGRPKAGSGAYAECSVRPPPRCYRLSQPLEAGVLKRYRCTVSYRNAGMAQAESM
jgi:hypothetical protein